MIKPDTEKALTLQECLARDAAEKKEREDKLINNLFYQILDKEYTVKFRPSFIRDLLLHVGRDGQSYKSLAFKLGVTTNTLYAWERRHPYWKEAKAIAQSGRLGHVERMLQGLADGSIKGNAAAAIFYAKNACPDEFKDKREMEVTGGVTYVIDTGIPSRPLPLTVEAECNSEVDDDEFFL